MALSLVRTTPGVRVDSGVGLIPAAGGDGLICAPGMAVGVTPGAG